MAHFQHCDYGPFQLRGLLRAHLEPGERVVAWGAATQDPQTHSALAAFALSIVPVVGVFLGPAVQRSNHVLLMVTDRRVLLAKSNTTGPLPEGRGLLLDASLERLHVSIHGHGVADLFAHARARRARLRLAGNRKQIARSRLWRSLVVLAGQAPQSPAADPGLEPPPTTEAERRAALPLDPRTDAA